jgi:hypothetical protein
MHQHYVLACRALYIAGRNKLSAVQDKYVMEPEVIEPFILRQNRGNSYGSLDTICQAYGWYQSPQEGILEVCGKPKRKLEGSWWAKSEGM